MFCIWCVCVCCVVFLSLLSTLRVFDCFTFTCTHLHCKSLVFPSSSSLSLSLSLGNKEKREDSGGEASAHSLGSNGDMELHVFRVCENLRGSFGQSLQLSMETIVLQALGHVLRVGYELHHFSSLLYWCQSRESDMLDLWLAIARPLQSSCHTGDYHFSDKLIVILGEVCQNVDQVANNIGQVRHMLHTIVDIKLTPAINESVTERILKESPCAYLHDFVASCIYPMQYVTFPFQFDLIKAVFDAVYIPGDFPRLYDLALVHWFYQFFS